MEKAQYEALGKTGGISTTPGSKQWALALKLKLQSVMQNNTAVNSEQLKAWRELLRQPIAYTQLLDENRKEFTSYDDLCRAKPPYGLGCEPGDIEKMINQIEASEPPKPIDLTEDPLKDLGNPSNYFHKFTKLVESCGEDQLLNAGKIGEILDYAHSTAQLWRKRWEHLGWLEQTKTGGRGFYQITETGKKAIKSWVEQQPGRVSNDNLWVVLPYHPKKAAEKLVRSFKPEELQEIYQFLGDFLVNGANIPSPNPPEPTVINTNVTFMGNISRPEINEITPINNVISHVISNEPTHNYNNYNS